MNAPEDLFTGHPLRFVPYAAAALCVAFFVALPNAAPAFLVPRKPSVDERGLDRGAAAEVEERLRRLKEAYEQLDSTEKERLQLELWVDLRRNAARWAPALCRIARSFTHPQRLDAIRALRFFGSEHSWEHWAHERNGTLCLLGSEPCRDDCEGTLRGLMREGGAARALALWSLSAYRTRSAAACLVAEADEENAPEISAYLNWMRGESWSMFHICGWAGEALPSPQYVCCLPGEERKTLSTILDMWRRVEAGREDLFPSKESVLRYWDIHVPR